MEILSCPVNWENKFRDDNSLGENDEDSDQILQIRKISILDRIFKLKTLKGSF